MSQSFMKKHHCPECGRTIEGKREKFNAHQAKCLEDTQNLKNTLDKTSTFRESPNESTDHKDSGPQLEKHSTSSTRNSPTKTTERQRSGAFASQVAVEGPSSLGAPRPKMTIEKLNSLIIPRPKITIEKLDSLVTPSSKNRDRLNPIATSSGDSINLTKARIDNTPTGSLNSSTDVDNSSGAPVKCAVTPHPTWDEGYAQTAYLLESYADKKGFAHGTVAGTLSHPVVTNFGQTPAQVLEGKESGKTCPLCPSTKAKKFMSEKSLQMHMKSQVHVPKDTQGGGTNQGRERIGTV